MGEDVPELRQVVLDSTDPRRLAEFYRVLLGYHYRPGDDMPAEGEDWLVIENDAGSRLAFQLVDSLPRSTWPDPGVPQQLHLDLTVPSPDALLTQHERAIALGARLVLDRYDDEEEPLRVYADPDGHPFCIFVRMSPARYDGDGRG